MRAPLRNADALLGQLRRRAAWRAAEAVRRRRAAEAASPIAPARFHLAEELVR